MGEDEYTSAVLAPRCLYRASHYAGILPVQHTKRSVTWQWAKPQHPRLLGCHLVFVPPFGLGWNLVAMGLNWGAGERVNLASPHVVLQNEECSGSGRKCCYPQSPILCRRKVLFLVDIPSFYSYLSHIAFTSPLSLSSTTWPSLLSVMQEVAGSLWSWGVGVQHRDGRKVGGAAASHGTCHKNCTGHQKSTTGLLQ